MISGFNHLQLLINFLEYGEHDITDQISVNELYAICNNHKPCILELKSEQSEITTVANSFRVGSNHVIGGSVATTPYTIRAEENKVFIKIGSE